MFSTINYKSSEKIYTDHLTMIGTIKFTFREIDLLACMVHNRGGKKIASLLSISPRTVNAHVYNIMSKLGVNSRDQVIDFIESSGKLPIIKEYYLYIRIRSSFKKQLAKISGYINKNKTAIYCYSDKVVNNEFLQLIRKHLRLANVPLLENLPNDSKGIAYFALSKINEENYYCDLLNALSELLKPNLSDDLVGEFTAAVARIQEEQIGSFQISDMVEPDQDEQITVKSSRKSFVLFVSLSFFLVIIAFFIYKGYAEHGKDIRVNYVKVPEIIKEVEELLSSLKEEKFSSVNTTPEQSQKNHSLIKKVEKLLDYRAVKEVQNYFDNTEMSSDFLTNYLYNLQALASYYMYNMHDGEHARKILLYGKELAESYVNNRSNVKSDFVQLQDSEILSELQIVSDLPQIYTRIIYSLARTYVYSSKNIYGNISIAESKKYFDLAKYLSRQLGLYEGYLSDISGILVIEKELAKIDIKEGKVDLAEKRLKQVISSFKMLQNDSKSYIFDYRPGTKEQKTVLPKDSLFSFFDCAIQIIDSYNLLLSATKGQKEINQYAQEVSQYLEEDNVLTQAPFKATNQISARKLANLYNTLGKLTINLWLIKKKENIGINIELLIQNIARLLAISPESDLLDFTEKIFTHAKDLSRNSDFTKADAYKGLAEVYQLKLEKGGNTLTTTESRELKERSNSAVQKSDIINKQLHRLNIKE